VPRILPALLLVLFAASLSGAEDTSFHNVRVPDAKGRLLNAVLTFSDADKAVEVRPAKGNAVSIPYAAIDKCSYEYTKQHRVSSGSVVTAPVGVGAVVMLTKSRSHWLEIDYHEQEMSKVFVLRMDKKNYIRILDAIKAHTGRDTEILGNANKR
jgi:hypothetical protein